MGFSGGGSNVLKPHTHDSTILQDGGNLNFQNITQSNMSAGSLTYSDGNHLQELGIGAADDLLTVSGGVPVWSSHGDYPVVKLLAVEEFAAPDSNENILITPGVDLATEYAEIIVVANLFTNNQVGGFGDIILYPNGSGGTFTNPYGYSITTAPAITALVVAATSHHQLGLPAMTTTNSSFHSETHISLAKSATTTDTVYMVTDSISDQGRSEHWQNTVDLGTTILSSVQVQASAASWTAGSNISIYGVKFA